MQRNPISAESALHAYARPSLTTLGGPKPPFAGSTGLAISAGSIHLSDVATEHRRSPRVVADVKVDYRTIGSFITDYTQNISKGGLFIQTSLPLEVGARVRLRLTLPGGDVPFGIDGIVKWVATTREKDNHLPGMGIEFVDFDEYTQQKLEALVRAYSGE